MKIPALLFFSAVALVASGSGFIDSLTPDQRARLGVESLTPTQRAELDAAVESYRQNAAAAAIDAYRKEEEPKVVTRAIEMKNKEDEAKRQERVESRIKGKFRGWFGGTTFELENGQVWKQVGSDTYATRAIDSPEIEISKSPYGYFRLRTADGAWVNVKRIK